MAGVAFAIKAMPRGLLSQQLKAWGATMRTIQWPLAMLACCCMVISPNLQAFADEPPAVTGPAPIAATEKAAVAVDLRYVPAEAVAAVVLHPQQVLTGENAEWLPVEVLTAGGLQNVGFDPTQIQEAIGIVAPPDMSNPPAPAAPPPGGFAPPPRSRPPEPGFGVILHFAQAYARRDVVAKLQPMRPVVKEFEGKKFALLRGPMPIGIFMPDDRTLVVGTDGLLQQMMAAKNIDSDLVKLLKSTDCSGTATAIFSLDAMRDLINQAMAHAPPVPPPFADFLKIPTLVSSGVIKADFRVPSQFSATLHAVDAKSAEELQQLIDRGLDMGRQMMLAKVAHQPTHDDPVQEAMQKYSVRITGRMFDQLKPAREGSDVKWATSGATGPGASVAVIGVLIALLLPAVQSARDAARRVQSMNNLKQISLSMLSYEAANNHYPARAIFSKEGKPLLSWRVQMLPYLDQTALYNQFHLDEAWDSPHNKALIANMPSTYVDATDPIPGGMTHYVVPVGKGLLFDGVTGLRIANITDGTSNTIMAVEADNTVIWTKPDDLEVDLQKPLNGLGAMRPTGFPAAFADGSVIMISNSITPATLKALFTRAGGEVINSSELDR